MSPAPTHCNSYHDTAQQTNPPAAVGVGHDVAVAHAQECNRHQPETVQNVDVLFVVIPNQQGGLLICDICDEDDGTKRERPTYVLYVRNNGEVVLRYLSHCRRVQLAMIHNETMKTRSTVPGQIVISVLRTNRVLKLMRFKAPMLRELASVNSFE